MPPKKPAILVIHRSGNHNQTHPMPHVQSAPSIILLPACYPRKSNWSHFPSSVANSCGISCAWSKALTIQAISTLSTTKFELCTFLFASVLLSTIRRLGCQMGQMLQVIAGNIVEYRAMSKSNHFIICPAKLHSDYIGLHRLLLTKGWLHNFQTATR